MTASGSFSLVAEGDGRLVASGPLTFATARRAHELALHLLGSGGGALTIDCAGIGAADSAGLAVLIDWLATAHRARRTLRFNNVPEGLTTLARISEVEQLLIRGV